MTDRYPSLTGPETPARPGWTAGRIVAAALGSVACLVGLALPVGGGVLLFVDHVARDRSGYITSDAETYRSTTPVLVTDINLPVGGPSWLSAPEQLGSVTVDVRPAADQSVFVGIGPRDEVLEWLSGTSFDEVTQLGQSPDYARTTGAGTAPDPEREVFWVARNSGADEDRLTWRAQQGDWTLVVMNTDRAGGVEVTAAAGVTMPHLDDVGVVLLVAGLLLLASGVAAIVFAVPGRRSR